LEEFSQESLAEDSFSKEIHKKLRKLLKKLTEIENLEQTLPNIN
jgi:hypothetical protein